MSNYVTDKMTHSLRFHDDREGMKSDLNTGEMRHAAAHNRHFSPPHLLPDTEKTTILRRDRHMPHHRDKKPWEPDYDPSLPNGGLSPEDAAMNESAYLFDTEKYTDPWAKTQSGRTMVRIFSRGLLGSSFYMVGQMMAKKQLAEYRWDKPLNELPGGGNFFKYPLRYLARGFDLTYGKAVKKGSEIALTPFRGAEAAKEASHRVFMQRNSTFFTSEKQLQEVMGDAAKGSEAWQDLIRTHGEGRSSGAEAVALTFDFAMGSTGDALGRYVARLTHPNTWEQYKGDDGKVKLSNVINDFGKTGWKIFSYNQMEDWAAAPLYVLQMRFQRRLLNKFFPGFEYNADLQKNGAGHVFNKQGQAMRSFALPGLLDLQFRFMGYNWYTLMFRDGYREIEAGIDKVKSNGVSSILPEINTLNPIELAGDALSSTWDGAKHLTKYSLRSLIKSQIYMAPAVPLFWVTRTPQTMRDGVPLFQEAASGNLHPMTFEKGAPYAENAATYSGIVERTEKGIPATVHSFKGKSLNITRPAGGVGVVGRALHWPGVMCEKAGEFMIRNTKGLEFLFKNSEQHKTFMRGFTNASISYTPYMIAKRETARLYDNKLMDNAIDKTLEGIAELDPTKAYSGLRTVENLVTHPPLTLFENVAQKNQHHYAKMRAPKKDVEAEEQKETQHAANANREPLKPNTANTNRVPTVRIEGAVLDKPAYAGLTQPASPEQAAASREIPDSSIDTASLEETTRIALDPAHISHSVH